VCGPFERGGWTEDKIWLWLCMYSCSEPQTFFSSPPTSTERRSYFALRRSSVEVYPIRTKQSILDTRMTCQINYVPTSPSGIASSGMDILLFCSASQLYPRSRTFARMPSLPKSASNSSRINGGIVLSSETRVRTHVYCLFQ
jgi:hypothetical protein